jgi:hypothetical protein
MKSQQTMRTLAMFAGAVINSASLLEPTPCAAQGAQITFNNRLSGVVIAPIYGLEPSNPQLCKGGNTPAGYPAGTQTYSGAPLAGVSYTAELWLGPQGAGEEMLVALTPSTTFQTLSSPGFIVPVPIDVPAAITPGSLITLQMRVWDNRGGTINSWAMVLADQTVPRGRSPVWVAVMPTGTPPAPVSSVMAGLRSFNLCQSVTPPPKLTITLRDTNSVIAAWPSPSTGWTLQDNTNLNTTNWSEVLTMPVDDGATKSVTVAPPLGTRFYRLHKP